MLTSAYPFLTAGSNPSIRRRAGERANHRWRPRASTSGAAFAGRSAKLDRSSAISQRTKGFSVPGGRLTTALRKLDAYRRRSDVQHLKVIAWR